MNVHRPGRSEDGNRPGATPAEVDDGQVPLSYGLTDEDLDLLRRERADAIEELVGTKDGRALIRLACPDLEGFGQALGGSVTDLGKRANSDNPLEARAAALVLNDLMQLSHQQSTGDLYHNRSKLYLKAQEGHRRVDTLVRSLSPKDNPRWKMMAWRWGRVGNAFTFLAVLALVASYWFETVNWFAVAATLIGVRMITTFFVWSRASYPADDSPDKPVLDSDPRLCVLGHSLDLMLFTAFALSLAEGTHVSAALLVVSAGHIMILGTIFRIGASASGYPVPRLHVERAVRGLSTLAAVLLAGIDSIQWWWSVVVMVTLPTLFAWIEIQEAWRAMKLKAVDPFEPITPSHRFDPSQQLSTEMLSAREAV